ncbi:MAG: hypothetical protein OEV94_01785 [Deltaproteobacteria bacterium]|nr:hypothetical protein [Deltaproteobacteria bacterium]
MMTSVSSWFLSTAKSQRVRWQRRFTLGDRDWSDRVLRWPVLAYKDDSIDLGTTQLTLANDQGPFTFLVGCDLALTLPGEISLGLTHPLSGPEWIPLYQGTPSHAAFSREGKELRLQLQASTQRLTDITLGSQVTSQELSFTGSQYYPADLAWLLTTQYGGMSSLAGSNNPDLDYPGWQAWRQENLIQDIRVQAQLTGEKLYRVLAHLAFLDQRAIAFDNGRLTFKPRNVPFLGVPPRLDPQDLLSLELSVDPTQVENDIQMNVLYLPQTRRFYSSHTRVNSRSVEAFGRRSNQYGQTQIWFARGIDAYGLVQNRLRQGGRPGKTLRARMPLGFGFAYSVGDVLTLTHSLFPQGQALLRVSGMEIDLAGGQTALTLTEAFHPRWEYLSTVASAALWPHTLQAVGSEDFVALGSLLGGPRLFRTDSAGFFNPLSHFGSALRVLSGGGLVLAGPPSSGSGQAVIQRSSDGGISFATVCSLAPGVAQVYDLFEVCSGTLLAGAANGGIWRSTDAGSSWAVTHTISYFFYLSRFYSPAPGVIWGGTGMNYPGYGAVDIWESTDSGASWANKHTIVTSRQGFVHGMHATSDGETLVGISGNGISEVGLYRSKTWAPSSTVWTNVLSGICFFQAWDISSGVTLLPFDQNNIGYGGMVYRTFDQGSHWEEDSWINLQGNIAFSPDRGKPWTPLCLIPPPVR